MATPELHTIVVKSTHLEAEGQVLLSLDVTGTPLEGTHERPGQYTFLQAQPEGKAYPFAIASPPSPTELEVLMKVPGERVDATLELKTVKAAPAAGPGYPLDRAEGKHLVFLAVGSAIAPIRSALMTAAKSPARFASIILIYGVREEAQFAFAADLSTAESAGARIVKTLSQPSGPWSGDVGRVQTLLKRELKAPTETVVCICGMPEMERDVRETLVGLGVAAASIHSNY